MRRKVEILNEAQVNDRPDQNKNRELQTALIPKKHGGYHVQKRGVFPRAETNKKSRLTVMCDFAKYIRRFFKDLSWVSIVNT